MVFSYRAPVPAREKVVVISWLSVNVVGEHGDHVFVRLTSSQFVIWKNFRSFSLLRQSGESCFACSVYLPSLLEEVY